jgi:phosphoribosylformylglycinamidine cyclo-ligase
LLERLFDAGVDVHYAVHVTGHGWRKLMRATQAVSYIIEKLPEVPPVLAQIVAATGMSPLEAYGTFNMGAGVVFYVGSSSLERALEVGAASSLFSAGYVEQGPRRVVLGPLDLTFEAQTLAIR